MDYLLERDAPVPAERKPVTLVLDRAEVEFVEHVALLRHLSNRGRRNTAGLSSAVRDVHYLGALGEYAVSVLYDRAWRPVRSDPWNMGHRDVGARGGIEVRTTEANEPHLILKERDDPRSVVYLVRVRYPHGNVACDVMGVANPAAAYKTAEFWRLPPGGRAWCYWIPWQELGEVA